MHCPVCRDVELVPTCLENGLTGHGCARCGGVLVSVLQARQWAETQSDAAWSGHIELVAETTTALTCPKCEHFMGKFRIDAGVGNRLDLCAHCGEFWLDAGEWNLLGALELRDKLPSIFSQPWQLGIRRRESAEDRQRRLLSALGPEDARRVQDFARWLDAHPQAALIRRRLELTH
jgi:Zn-finger nucleic acid-binding protein